MPEGRSKGVAAILAALPVIGWIGGDKYYVGATGLGIAQTVLTLTIFGLLVTMPWAWLSAFALVLSILFGIAPFLYPDVKWLPTTKADKIIGWVIVGLYVIGIIIGMIRSMKSQKDDYRGPKELKEDMEMEKKKGKGKLDFVCNAYGCK